MFFVQKRAKNDQKREKTVKNASKTKQGNNKKVPVSKNLP